MVNGKPLHHARIGSLSWENGGNGEMAFVSGSSALSSSPSVRTTLSSFLLTLETKTIKP